MGSSTFFSKPIIEINSLLTTSSILDLLHEQLLFLFFGPSLGLPQIFLGEHSSLVALLDVAQ
jgi:hypothetical protein